MRMTRAALRAQEAEEELQAQIEGKLREQGLSTQTSDMAVAPAIYEDIPEEQIDITNVESSDQQPDNPRHVLRDITSENYPNADIAVGEVLNSEANAMQTDVKGAKKAKSKKGKKGSAKKQDDIVVQEVGAQTPSAEHSTVDNNISQPVSDSSRSDGSLQMEDDPSIELGISQTCLTEGSGIVSELCETNEKTHPNQSATESEPSVGNEANDSEPREKGIPMIPITPVRAAVTVSKTPKFNPDIHLAADSSLDDPFGISEDSFVDTIKTRSPSKFLQSGDASVGKPYHDLNAGAARLHSPPKPLSRQLSSGSQRIEDSVEAIDALEDAIEKFAEDLPAIEALPFESPIRSHKSPTRTPARAAVSASAKVLAPLATRTPVKTPARSPVKMAEESITSKSTTPPIHKINANSSPATTRKANSVKIDTVMERVKAIESKATSAIHRRATSVHVSKKAPPEVKQTPKSRHAATKSVPAITSAAAPTMTTTPSSNSPMKQTANQPKKRVTSGNVLSTAKPAFIPAKSNKPLTTSTFVLPGEAVAAKLKAQREKRLEREESEVERKTTFKARPAPAKSTRPAVLPRENKASSARINMRQASSENKENVAPIKNSTGSTSTSASTSTSTTATAKPSVSSAIANSGARRATIAPKAASSIESRKGRIGTATAPGQPSRRVTSLISGLPSTVTKTEAVQQKLRGKEVHDRIKSSLHQQEEEKKTKEEAAKKARAEAAERGRQASREWAEKQKKKLAVNVKSATTVAISS